MNANNLNDLLKVLKKVKKEIVLLGHDTLDCDSAVSILLFSRLLNFLDIKNKIVICDKEIHDIDLEILGNVGIDLNQFKGSVNVDEPLFLLDHYKTAHSLNVIGCIDHHPNAEDIQYPFYLNKSSASTGKIIYDFMEGYGYPITMKEVELTILSIMLDTSSLKSTKCPDEHKVWTKEIIKKYNLDYNKYYNIGLCLSNLNKPIDVVVQEGLKKYCYSNIKVCSSYIQVNSEVDIDKLTKFIQSNFINEATSLWVFLVHDFRAENTFEYRITKDNIRTKVYSQITSRGTTIMPVIEKDIKNII